MSSVLVRFSFVAVVAVAAGCNKGSRDQNRRGAFAAATPETSREHDQLG